MNSEGLGGFEPQPEDSVFSRLDCTLVPLGTGCSFLSTENGLGANGHVAGVVAVHDIVAQRALVGLEITGQGTLDLDIARCSAEIQVALRHVQAAAFKANVDDLDA